LKVLVIGFGSAGQRYAKYLLKAGAEVLAYDPISADNVDWRKYDNVDAFVIASPSKTHKAWLLELMKFKKPILVEKPAVMNLEQWEEVHKVQLKYETPIYVAYQMRFLPSLWHIQNNLERYKTAKFGFRFGFDVRQWHPNNSYTPRDGILLEASHEIDLSLRISRLLDRYDIAVSEITNFYDPTFGVNECDSRFRLCGSTAGFCRHDFHLDYIHPTYERAITIQSSVPKWRETITIDKDGMEPAYQLQAEEFMYRVDTASQPNKSRFYELATFEESREVLRIIQEVKGDR